jgi:hypothetical protein
MTADARVSQAREFLAAAARHKVSELPPSVLVRELAEARRVLGQLLTLADDFIDEDEALRARTHVEAGGDGGAWITPADMAVLADALADAFEWRQPAMACADCEHVYGGHCADHAEDAEKAAAYAALAQALGIEVPS